MTESSTHIWTGDDLSDAEFAAIAELLRDRRQFDLGQYKDRCIRRRIAKRLRACQVDDFASYLKKLEVDRDELDTLLATISIHVSHFFRNPDTFQILEQKVLPDLCRRAKAAGRTELTLWSAGCASGEEAYSLALLVDDLGATDLNIRILATDISKPVLKTAQQGIFEATRVREIPPEVLEKYFYIEDGNYQLIDRIRDKVEFLRHNIMTADEYPAADLILCRNVLIYFTRQEQERILSRFAVALPEHGALILGRSETLTGNIRCYYQSEFPVERVYRRTAEPVAAPAVEGADPEGLSVSVDCCP
jgi:chemotaxis protein methyltransferase CheR